MDKIWYRNRFTTFDSNKVENLYGAKFVGQRVVGDRVIPVYFQPHPDVSKGHSSFFGLYFGVTRSVLGEIESAILICNALSHKHMAIGVVNKKTGELLISRYRHDYHSTQNGSFYVDGGQAYIRIVGNIADAIQVEVDLSKMTVHIPSEGEFKIEVRNASPH